MGAEVGSRLTSAVEARRVLGMRVDGTSYDHAATEIIGWASRGESRYVCIATVNNVIEAHDNPAYQRVLEHADLVTPDGMPLVWGLGLLGVRGATRVYGPDLTPILCERAAAAGIPVGFYGSTPEVLADLTTNLARQYPDLQVVYTYSPPFRPLTPEEDAAVRERIDQSGVRLLFVGLGTPKQELWMAANTGPIQTVMVGVGAAFDFIAGRKRQAPNLMQRLGLEWLFRLVNEPRRLWRRYLYRNPRFVVLFAAQLFKHWFFGDSVPHRQASAARNDKE